MLLEVIRFRYNSFSILQRHVYVSVSVCVNCKLFRITPQIKKKKCQKRQFVLKTTTLTRNNNKSKKKLIKIMTNFF